MFVQVTAKNVGGVFFETQCSSTWKVDVLWMCKLGVISQERLKIQVKLLLSAIRKSSSASTGTTTDVID